MNGRRGTRAKTRGYGYSGPDSTRPAQQPEKSSSWGNLPGGSAPGGTVGVPLSTRQALAETPTSRPNANNVPEVGDGDAAGALAQGHPKSAQVKRSW